LPQLVAGWLFLLVAPLLDANSLAGTLLSMRLFHFINLLVYISHFCGCLCHCTSAARHLGFSANPPEIRNTRKGKKEKSPYFVRLALTRAPFRSLYVPHSTATLVYSSPFSLVQRRTRHGCGPEAGGVGYCTLGKLRFPVHSLRLSISLYTSLCPVRFVLSVGTARCDVSMDRRLSSALPTHPPSPVFLPWEGLNQGNGTRACFLNSHAAQTHRHSHTLSLFFLLLTGEGACGNEL